MSEAEDLRKRADDLRDLPRQNDTDTTGTSVRIVGYEIAAAIHRLAKAVEGLTSR